jgi:hypothetical protein
MVSGYNFEIPVFPHDYFWTIQANSPSGVFLFPDPAVFNEHVLVSDPHRNYSASQLRELVKDIDVPGLSNFFETTYAKAVHTLKAPMVDTWTFQASGEDTPLSFLYSEAIKSDTPNSVPQTTVMIDGDGTVPLISALSINKWEQVYQQAGFKLRSTMLHNVNHLGMLSDANVLDAIVKVLVHGSLFNETATY